MRKTLPSRVADSKPVVIAWYWGATLKPETAARYEERNDEVNEIVVPADTPGKMFPYQYAYCVCVPPPCRSKGMFGLGMNVVAVRLLTLKSQAFPFLTQVVAPKAPDRDPAPEPPDNRSETSEPEHAPG